MGMMAMQALPSMREDKFAMAADAEATDRLETAAASEGI
jgi:hypothetical protein